MQNSACTLHQPRLAQTETLIPCISPRQSTRPTTSTTQSTCLPALPMRSPWPLQAKWASILLRSYVPPSSINVAFVLLSTMMSREKCWRNKTCELLSENSKLQATVHGKWLWTNGRVSNYSSLSKHVKISLPTLCWLTHLNTLPFRFYSYIPVVSCFSIHTKFFFIGRREGRIQRRSLFEYTTLHFYWRDFTKKLEGGSGYTKRGSREGFNDWGFMIFLLCRFC